jgi:hypothetical protein
MVLFCGPKFRDTHSEWPFSLEQDNCGRPGVVPEHIRVLEFGTTSTL